MEAALFLNGASWPAVAAVKKVKSAAAAARWGGAGKLGVYRECLKNHAASLGGHALDGCGEFMPAPDADPADPASLRCAACGCHRNFHRRLHDAPPSPPLLALPPPPPPPPQLQVPAPAPAPAAPPHVIRERDGRALPGEETPEDRRLPASAFDDETEDESDEGSDFDEDRPLSPMPAPAMGGPPPGYLHQAPHMLLALSTGAPSAPAAAVAPWPSGSLGPTMTAPGAAAAAASAASAAASASAAAARKRFRTRFSPEQKQQMRALSERLGWRLQKRDEAVVDDSCREIGVTKSVFKVWMHNNKHNFVGGHSARRSASASAAAIATGGIAPILHSPHAAAVLPSVDPSVHAAPAPPPPPPAAPVHADFNINGTASADDYFRIQPAMAPSTASGGSPQSC